MTPTLSPLDLKETFKSLIKKGSTGCLLSGGFTNEGILPIDPFLPVIKEITSKSPFQIVLHSGLVDPIQAHAIADSGIKIVSVDLIGAQSTIKKVYGLQKSPEDFLQNILTLKQAGIQTVVPHITLGLEYGKIVGETNALDSLVRLSESTHLPMLVFLVLIPASETEMDAVVPPTPKEVGRIIAASRVCLPDTEISLGCMRPTSSLRIEYDKYAIASGANRIVMIRPEANLHLEEQGYNIIERAGCCTLT
jgi:uncharacterized radical SAM superfamily protein